MDAIADGAFLGDGADLRDLREGLHRDVTRRWVRAARNVKRAIVLHDALGIGEKAPMSVMPAADRAAMFGRWLDERLLADIGDGQWVFPYIAESALRAQAQHGRSWNGFGDARVLGALIDAGPDDEPRDPHGRWTSGGGEGEYTTASFEKERADRFRLRAAASEFYHGTSKQAADQIIQEGLVAARGAGADIEAAQRGWNYAEGRNASVFMTQRLDIAKQYAELAAKVTNSVPVIMKVVIPKGHVDKLKPDEQSAGTDWSFRYEGNIPRQWVSRDVFSVHDAVRHAGAKTVYIVILTKPPNVTDAQALGSLVSQTSYIEPKSVKVCQAATCGALADIRGAVSRRASEAVRTGLLFPPHSKRAPRIAKAVDAAMGEGLQRSRMLAEHSVTQAYSQATLDALEARGVTHVGTVAGHRRLRDYAPDQPRDEHGRWASGGGGAESGEKITPEGEKGGGMSHEQVRAVADKVAEDLGFDSSRIDVVAGTKQFNVNGVMHVAAGDAEITKGEQGRIRLFADHLRPDSVAAVTAHEIEHEKFQGALDAYRRESDAISKDPGPPPDPDHPYFWGKRGGSDAIMKPDGSLREPYDKKYPNYTAIHDAYFAHGLEEFHKGDGVSDYSAEYWKGWHERTVGTDIALHETLAEMARIKYTTGRFPEHFGYSRMISERLKTVAATPEGYVAKAAGEAKGTNLWRNLYRAVDSVYKNRFGQG